MKKFPFSTFAVCFIMLLSFNILKAQKTKKTSAQSSSILALNGGWQRVSVKVNDKVESGSPEFRVYHDGYFSIIGQDSTGAWKETHGGTYEISGNLYKEKILYSSFADRMGVIHWQEFTVKGDTATFKLFKKLINYQGDVATLPKIEMVCVRMKK
jgi:hypothetical protein